MRKSEAPGGAVSVWIHLISRGILVDKDWDLGIASSLSLKKLIRKIEKEAGVNILSLIQKETTLVILVNNRPFSDLKQVIQDGDRISIWQPLLGG